MASKWTLLFFVSLTLGFKAVAQKAAAPEPAFQFLTEDSILLDIYPYFDAGGVLDGYRSHIRSPVCEDRLCYEAELDFEWDIIGRFTGFQVDEKKPLSKLDHIPFDEADYNKLRNILLTESPSFIHLRRSELVAPLEMEGDEAVDAMSGATVQSVKKDMVAGAIYTCYTLWHIANGGIRFNIQEYSREQLDSPLVKKLLDQEESAVSYFVVEHLDSSLFEPFLQKLLPLAGAYDAFFLERMIKRMPDRLLAKTTVQQFLREQFHRLQPDTREHVISKWRTIKSLQVETLLFLTEQFEIQDSDFNHQIIQLIAERKQAEQIEIIEAMVKRIRESDIHVPPESLRLLNQLAQTDRRLKKTLKPIIKK